MRAHGSWQSRWHSTGCHQAGFGTTRRAGHHTARARSLPLPVVAERLEQRFALLMGGAGTAHARQRTLEASVAWSNDLLDETEQAALCHLSTFSGPFDLSAAEAVMAVDRGNTVDLVTSLLDKSLLAEESRGSTPRYRMLETVRYFARDRSVQSGDATACRERHLVWVRDEVERCSGRFESEGAAEAVLRIDLVLEEVRAAMDWALTSGRAIDALEITAALGWYWIWRGLAGEGGRWLERSEATLAVTDTAIDTGLAARVAFTWRRQPSRTGDPRHDPSALRTVRPSCRAGRARRRRVASIGVSPSGRSSLCRSSPFPFWRSRRGLKPRRSRRASRRRSGSRRRMGSCR